MTKQKITIDKSAYIAALVAVAVSKNPRANQAHADQFALKLEDSIVVREDGSVMHPIEDLIENLMDTHRDPKNGLSYLSKEWQKDFETGGKPPEPFHPRMAGMTLQAWDELKPNRKLGIVNSYDLAPDKTAWKISDMFTRKPNNA
jgi:hypothetical protein